MSLCVFGKKIREVIRNMYGCDLIHIWIEIIAIKMNPYSDKEIYLIDIITIFKQYFNLFHRLGVTSLPLTSNGCIQNKYSDKMLLLSILQCYF